MAVFDQIERELVGPAGHAEPYASYLNRAGGQFWGDIRELVEDWFSHLCKDAQADVRARLRASDDRHFHAAFLELYLHESLLRAGFEVECHPELPGRKRRPDFLASRGAESFYVEARSVSPSDELVVANNRRGTVYDALNNLSSPNFFLWIDVDEESATGLRTKPLRRALEEWLASLDPDEIGALMERDGLQDLPAFPWEADGWKLSFRPIPKSKEARGDDTGLRPLGVYGPARASWIDDTTPLRDAMSDKAGAYGDLDRGYVIALAASSVTTDDFDITNALYGSDQVQFGWTETGETVTRSVRAPDGFWYGGAEWKHRHVSGVLLARHLHPGAIASHVPTFWEHPDPLHAVRALPGWRRAAPVDGQLQFFDPEMPPDSIFALPTPWPRGEPFAE